MCALACEAGQFSPATGATSVAICKGSLSCCFLLNYGADIICLSAVCDAGKYSSVTGGHAIATCIGFAAKDFTFCLLAGMELCHLFVCRLRGRQVFQRYRRHRSDHVHRFLFRSEMRSCIVDARSKQLAKHSQPRTILSLDRVCCSDCSSGNTSAPGAAACFGTTTLSRLILLQLSGMSTVRWITFVCL